MDIKEVIFSEEEIALRVKQMGKQISADYADVANQNPRGLVVISVLRGAAIFMADLVRQIDIPVEMDYMAVSSYGNGVQSSGVVRILKDLNTDICGRHVLIAEDILDSGLTLKYLVRTLQSRNPASLEIATFLHKQTEFQTDVDCKYIGFECPDKFIVGYGLDYDEKYRNLPYVGVLGKS